MTNVSVNDHPLVQQGLTTLRDQRTPPEQFRRVMEQVTLLLAFDATRDLETRSVQVRTPVAGASGHLLRRPVLLAPILRAGQGMLNAFLTVIPDARVAFLGMRRSEKTLRPSAYLKSLPEDLSSFDVVLLDPMLATGGSTLAAVNLLSRRGARRVRTVHLIAAPQGIARLHRKFPLLPIHTAAIDPRLNRQGFIVPGLGDAGDRLFGL